VNTTDEPVFAAPWQARAFALTLCLHEKGLFPWSEWTDTLASEIAANPTRDYYDCWLAALEQIVIRHNAVQANEIEVTQVAWLAAANRTPHGEPITLESE
jgi:nitrile hydratase accessory protein